LNLERSIDRLAKRFDKLYPVVGSSNKTGLSHWKGKPIIPLEEWIQIQDTSYALDYFPDDFDRDLIYMLEDELNVWRKQKDVKKWYSDFLELMEYTKNPSYGRLKCFHCLLSSDGDDPIFIGINRLVAKGLSNDSQEKDGIGYPCQVVNRFQCPFERTTNKGDDDAETAKSYFDVDDLFRLHKIAFVVEIALAKARKDDSEIQIRDKQDLLYVLTDRDTFAKILHQADDLHKSTEYFREITVGQDADYIVDYFMRIKDKIALEELKFY
jgi:hypothetical protein